MDMAARLLNSIHRQYLKYLRTDPFKEIAPQPKCCVLAHFKKLAELLSEGGSTHRYD